MRKHSFKDILVMDMKLKRGAEMNDYSVPVDIITAMQEKPFAEKGSDSSKKDLPTITESHLASSIPACTPIKTHDHLKTLLLHYAAIIALDNHGSYTNKEMRTFLDSKTGEILERFRSIILPENFRSQVATQEKFAKKTGTYSMTLAPSENDTETLQTALGLVKELLK